MPPCCTQTDRQTNRQTDRQTDRRTNKGLWAFTVNCSGINVILTMVYIMVATISPMNFYAGRAPV